MSSTRSFISLGKGTQDHDPFITRTPSDENSRSPSNRGMRRRASREHTKKPASCRSTPSANDKIMKNWRITEAVSDVSSPTDAKRVHSDHHVCVPDTVIIDKNNCQLYYSPDSCLFVAK